ncbi:MAG: hypothetical protein M3548_22260 [Actinomycetota bacterium]|nr:hypothetical protein [Actinomycetota bacterium]
MSEWFGAQGAVIAMVGAVFDDLALVPMIAVLVVIGTVVGVVSSLGLFVEYRLTRESSSLLMRRGLLTTRSLSLEECRLRGIEVVEPLGTRLAGAGRLDAVASGLTV